MNCDFCGSLTTEEDSFLVLPDAIVEATASGFIPTCLVKIWGTELKKHGSGDENALKAPWKKLVTENASVDWLLCPECHLELVRYRKTGNRER